MAKGLSLYSVQQCAEKFLKEGLTKDFAPNSVSCWQVRELANAVEYAGALVLTMSPGDGKDFVAYHAIFVDERLQENEEGHLVPTSLDDVHYSRQLHDSQLWGLRRQTHSVIRKIYPGRDSSRYRDSGFMVVPDLRTLAAEMPLRNFITTITHQLRHHLSSPLR